jgi:4-amino-4-deoxy-L-arabinose transferase-like glycosyltransferase
VRAEGGDAAGRRAVLAVCALLIVAVIANVWWVERFRTGFPLDIDESRYVSFSLTLNEDLSRGDLGDIWTDLRDEVDFAPLLPAVSVPVFTVFGEDLNNAFLTQLAFLVLLGLATFGIARRLVSAPLAALATLVVLTVPGVIDFSRSYQFVIPSTALVVCATYALLASEGLARRGWALAWGALLGLTLLSRTMTLAFVPGQLAAAAWMLYARRSAIEPRLTRRRLVNLGLGGLAMVLVALPWYSASGGTVFRYLTGFGYGAESTAFGAERSPLAPSYWGQEAAEAAAGLLYFPLALLLAASLLLGAVALAIRLRRTPGEQRRAAIHGMVSGDGFIVLLLFVEGYVALTSSRNQGVGFAVPMIPLAVLLAVVALDRLPWRRRAAALAIAFAAVGAFNFTMKLGVSESLGELRTVDPPGTRVLTVSNGEGWIQGYVRGAESFALAELGRPAPPAAPTSRPAAREKAWLPFYGRVVGGIEQASDRAGREPQFVIGVDEPLVNPYVFELAARRRLGTRLVVDTLLAPQPAGVYRAVLAQMRPAPNAVLLVRPPGMPFYPPADQGNLARALVSLGFARRDVLRLPDERRAVLLQRP